MCEFTSLTTKRVIAKPVVTGVQGLVQETHVSLFTTSATSTQPTAEHSAGNEHFMNSTIDRQQHLETLIADSERELGELRGEAEQHKRMKAQCEELIRFRGLVDDARAKLAGFDSTTEGLVSEMKTIADESAQIGPGGVIVNTTLHLEKINRVSDALKQNLLARARHARQLENLSTRLEGMERQNEQRPEEWRV